MYKKTTLLLAALILFVVVGAFALTVEADTGSSVQKDVCAGKSGFSTMVHIHDGKVSNNDLKAKLCDKIMFMNSDAVTRKVGFGPHDEHVPYNGVGEMILNEGDMYTITLNQTGMFHWHDHLHEEIEGYFMVTE